MIFESIIVLMVCFSLCIVSFPSLPLSNEIMPDLMNNASNFLTSFEKIQQYKKNKMVLLILDGMSYRFSNYNESFTTENLVNTTDAKGDPRIYTNKIKFFKELELKEPGNIIHIPKYIDGPTWTKFCLQSMIHGSLPSQSPTDMFIESKAMD